MKSRRRKLREKILQILYAYEMHGGGLSLIMDDLLEDVMKKDDEDFVKGIVEYVLAESDDIESRIRKRLVNWDVSRIAVIDKILLRIGIGESCEHTLEEVGQNFAVTRERIRQIEAKALRKLRHPSRSKKLKSFLDEMEI